MFGGKKKRGSKKRSRPRRGTGGGEPLPSGAAHADAGAGAEAAAGDAEAQAAAPPADEAPPSGIGAGSRVGRYTLVKQLGQGGMGSVYLARDPVIGRDVAIKIIHIRPDLSEEDALQYRERFLREAQAAGALFHSNIVAVHDIGQDPATRRPYIVMEYVPGQDLKKVLRSRGALPVPEAVRIVLQIAAGLDFAHRRGIVHRDIKPANILLGERGQVKITDFGVAHLPGSDLTQADQFVGSPGFMSPEQLKGGAIDGRSDLFALGVILYQLLTGRSPFEGESVSEVLYRISTQPIELPSEAHPDLSADFDPILEKALSKKPEERYQTGREMCEALLGAARPFLEAEAAPDGGGAEESALEEVATDEPVAVPRAAEAVSMSPPPIEEPPVVAAAFGAREAAASEPSGAAPAGSGAAAEADSGPDHGPEAGPIAETDLTPRSLRARRLSPWLSLNSQWRLGALVAVLLAAFVGVNWGIHALMNGPLGRLIAGQEASAAPRNVPAPLAMVGAGGPIGVAGAARPGTEVDPETAALIKAAGAHLPPSTPDKPIRAICAMTYAEPAELARIAALIPRTRAARNADRPEAPPAQVRLELSYELPQGRVVVLMDGNVVFSKPFDGSKSKTPGRLSHVMSVPAGRHGLEVQVTGSGAGGQLRSKTSRTLSTDAVAVLRVTQTSGRHDALKLKWGPDEKAVEGRASRHVP